MAEQLRSVDDPLAPIVEGLAEVSSAEVARAMLRAIEVPDSRPLPAWLRPEQRRSGQRLLAALERHGGALLADPVGSGKTWVALGVAAVLGGPALAVVPAALRSHWLRIAGQAGVTISVHSHEALSRGRAPSSRAGLVIVDEGHRFRTPGTRRYRTLAVWLGRRPLILLTATPVVNRLEDLAHQLRLGIADSALAHRGTPSLLRSLRAGRTPAGLSELVIAGPVRVIGAPLARSSGLVRVDDPGAEVLAREIGRLGVAASPGVRALVLGGLWRAQSSSPAALAVALGRYLGLLRQAADARQAGRPLGRASLRAFLAGMEEQLVLWELMPVGAESSDLILDDLGPVEALTVRIRASLGADDCRAARLRALLSDRQPTIVFSWSRATVDWLKTRLARLGPAWCTGERAGIGHTIMDRDAVLGWFRPEARGGPPVLITTDVSAEGLDLHRAARVVHYDLPWTSVRVDQREGRVRRLGGVHQAVEIHRWGPPVSLERRLRQVERLRHKRQLPGQAGLSPQGGMPPGWRIETEVLDDGGPARIGLATATGQYQGTLVGLALDWTSCRHPVELVWLGADGRRVSQPRFISSRLLEAMAAGKTAPLTTEARQVALTRVRLCARQRLQAAHSAQWQEPAERCALAALGRRLRRTAAGALRGRDESVLALVERCLHLMEGRRRAGEVLRLAGMASLDDRALARGMAQLPPPQRAGGLVPRIVGIIHFQPMG